MAAINQNGFFAFHANHLEDLRDVVVTICKTAPLAPLSKDLFLVQSNGIAQWLKLALAENTNKNGLGIAAGIDTSLPSSFIWLAYRAVLSAIDVPESSPLDKVNLAWRLYRLLPTLYEQKQHAMYAPLLQFMKGNNPSLRRFQLAQRLADLYDQYQVYRADWLQLWEQGKYSIAKTNGTLKPLEDSQRWQAMLWQLILQDIGSEMAKTSRASVHQTFLSVCRDLDKPANPHLLPERIFVFGVTSMPKQMLEALHAVSRFTQVVFCVVNPCQYYWGDIVSDRELFVGAQKRGQQSPKLSQIELDELHQHANPLLASLGKQGRDYIRLLDTFDNTDTVHAAKLSEATQIDIYRDYEVNQLIESDKDKEVCSLLQQIQNDILHLTPVDEIVAEKRILAPKAFHTIAFHQVHSPQREAEVLHDQLLAAFDRDKDLKPSDIIVMMPDVNVYAPYIRAVFGMFDSGDPRHIPFTISDQGLRHQEPMIIAFEQLLTINSSRFSYSEVMSLLELPAISERFDISSSDLSLLKSWIAGANIRWGLSPQQRADVIGRDNVSGNTWQEGLQSMLLGYSIADEQVWQDIQAYPEVGGLQASLVGQLMDFIRALEKLAENLQGEHHIKQWQTIVLAMLSDFFISDDSKIDMLKTDIIKQLDSIYKEFASGEALSEQFDIDILSETLLSRLDKSTINHRFMIGKVNFATLMPMRAIPFKHVYLLGMNNGDYPRTAKKVDFDLMAHDYRPGDRSVREDDRYLFLEAMLSARKALYISWVGRSIKDDSEQPPSILVAQLQDYITKFYTTHIPIKNSNKYLPAIDLISTQHPLQAFSPLYFAPLQDEQDAQENIDKTQIGSQRTNRRPLFTYAKEWHSAITEQSNVAAHSDINIEYLAPAHPLSLSDLSEFMRSPVATFYQKALGVRFDELAQQDNDNETFALNPLQESMLIREIINDVVLASHPANEINTALSAHINKLVKRGVLGIVSTPSLLVDTLKNTSAHIFDCYSPLLLRFKAEYEQDIAIDFDASLCINGDKHSLSLQDTITDLRVSHIASVDSTSSLAKLVIATNKTFDDQGIRFESFIPHWVMHVAGNAMATKFNTYIVSKESKAVTHFPAIEADTAQNILEKMMVGYARAMTDVLPIEAKAAFAFLQNSDSMGDIQDAYEKAYKFDKGYLRKAFGDNCEFLHSAAFKALARELYGDLYNVLSSQQLSSQ